MHAFDSHSQRLKARVWFPLSFRWLDPAWLSLINAAILWPVFLLLFFVSHFILSKSARSLAASLWVQRSLGVRTTSCRIRKQIRRAFFASRLCARSNFVNGIYDELFYWLHIYTYKWVGTRSRLRNSSGIIDGLALFCSLRNIFAMYRSLLIFSFRPLRDASSQNEIHMRWQNCSFYRLGFLHIL